MSISKDTQNILLRLARESIMSEFRGGRMNVGEIPNEAKSKSGTFVTLTINGELRGCIGVIEPIAEIANGVIENAKKAAFEDPRFPPLEENEMKNVRIEVSVLSTPRKIELKTEAELLVFLKKNKLGLIIEKGLSKATFLPQVWDELSDPVDFLTHLCVKAGLSSNEWRNPADLSISAYSAFHFSEKRK